MRGRIPKSGSYAGVTGTVQSINVGFRPKYVRIVAAGSPTTGQAITEITEEMPAGKAFRTFTSAAGVTDLIQHSGNSITLGANGFLVGTVSTTVNGTGGTYYWIAY